MGGGPGHGGGGGMPPPKDGLIPPTAWDSFHTHVYFFKLHSQFLNAWLAVNRV